jgi:hypothetical protein
MEAFVAHLQLFEAISSFEAVAYFKLAALLLKVIRLAVLQVIM